MQTGTRFSIICRALRTTYASQGVTIERSPVVVVGNNVNGPATILKYYAKLPEVVMRRFVESKPMIPNERI